MTDLKPCPFCGGEARIKTWEDRWGNWNAQVYCVNSYGKSKDERCQAEFFVMKFAAKERVIEEITSKWNTRPNPWHTGTPTEDGYYLCHIQFYSEDYESDEEGYDITYEFKNGSWEEDDENVRIIAWQKIDHYKEKEK